MDKRFSNICVSLHSELIKDYLDMNICYAEHFNANFSPVNLRTSGFQSILAMRSATNQMAFL